jgi:hypothetical protein
VPIDEIGREAEQRSGTFMGALLRFLAGVFLLVAVIFAVNDATRLAGPDRASAVTVHQTWSAVAPNSLNAAQRAVQNTTHPGVWNWGVLWLLQLPAWTLFGLLGLILAFVGRRRRRVNIYAN